MIVRVKQEDVARKRRRLLLPLHLVVADIAIVPAVHVVVEVLPNLAAVFVGPAAVLVYAIREILVAVPKEAHALKTHENRLSSHIRNCRSV